MQLSGYLAKWILEFAYEEIKEHYYPWAFKTIIYLVPEPYKMYKIIKCINYYISKVKMSLRIFSDVSSAV